jgi:hypothetical protein
MEVPKALSRICARFAVIARYTSATTNHTHPIIRRLSPPVGAEVPSPPPLKNQYSAPETPLHHRQGPHEYLPWERDCQPNRVWDASRT